MNSETFYNSNLRVLSRALPNCFNTCPTRVAVTRKLVTVRRYVVIYNRKAFINLATVGLWCGSVGKEITSDTIGTRFESSHLQTLGYVFTVN